MQRSFFAPLTVLASMLTFGCGEQSDVTSPTRTEEASSPIASPSSQGRAANAATTFHEPISFTVGPDQCSELSTTVTGTGTSHVVVHESVQPDGTIHFSFHNNIQGTATGADGSTYRFNYTHNEAAIVESLDAPFEIRLVDKFRLIAQGSTPDISVFQYYDFILNPDGSFIDLRVHVRGDPHCDAI